MKELLTLILVAAPLVLVIGLLLRQLNFERAERERTMAGVLRLAETVRYAQLSNEAPQGFDPEFLDGIRDQRSSTVYDVEGA